MSNLQHYVPVLRAKDGELTALEHTEPSVHERMTPIMELHARPIGSDGNPSKDVAAHLATVTSRLVASRGRREVFIDPWPLIGAEDLNPATTIREVARAASDAELNAVPVTAPGRTGAYQAQVAQAVRDGAGRVCVRLTAARYGDAASLPQRLEALMKRCGVDPHQVHMVVDMAGDLQPIARTLLAFLPRRDEWAGLSLIFGGFPSTLSGVVGLARIPRIDWQLWQKIRRDEQNLTTDEDDDGGIFLAPRTAGFGDYGPRAAATADLPFAPAPNLRYTLEEEWLVVRGAGGPTAPRDQVYDLCARIVHSGDFKERSYSWGDTWIFDRGYGDRSGPGSPTTWITVALTHHMKLVTEQLATLSGP